MDRYDPYTDSFIVDTSNIDQFYVRTVQLVELTDECIEKIVNKIAEVKHERQRGEWIQHVNEPSLWSCSVCKTVIYSEHEEDRLKFHKWCGCCGAYMRGDND